MNTPAGRRETGGGGPALRADARANRARILDVAEEVFGQGGESASTEEVARLAGVGIATVFRHFPTKAALLEAVLARRFGRLREHAEELLGAGDPGQAFAGFFRYLVADAPAKIGIIRDDVELAEVYALLVGVSRAAARDHLGDAGIARVLTVVFDGLAPRA
jgi:AcrR family transcriptional regulator